jgi:hypothetical protein
MINNVDRRRLRTEAVMENWPKRLYVAIGGYMGTSYSIELSAGKLRYVVYEHGYATSREETITPTAEQWSKFRAALDSIGVWQWKSHYPPQLGICDGTGWTLEVSYEDIEVYSDGDNSYPEDEEDDESQLSAAPSRRFERFLKTVSDLIDGRDFA